MIKIKVPDYLGKNEDTARYETLNWVLSEYHLLELNRGVEVGVRRGETAEYLLRTNPKLFLECVDPYLPYLDLWNKFYTAEEQNAIRDEAEKSLIKYINEMRCYFNTVSSAEAAQLNDGLTYDFVFIDAQHVYESVFADCTLWWPHVRSGGILAGHDYVLEAVSKAVEDFVNKLPESTMGKPSICATGYPADIWFIVKS